MTRRILIYISLAAAIGCTTSAPPAHVGIECPDAAPADTAPPLDTVPDAATDSGVDADTDAGLSCPGTLVLSPVIMAAESGTGGWAFCDDSPPVPLLNVQVFRDGVIEQDIDYPCNGSPIFLGRFAPGLLHIAASHGCLAVGRNLTEPDACVHESDEPRPVGCAPTVVEIEACQTQYVAFAVGLTERCPPP